MPPDSVSAETKRAQDQLKVLDALVDALKKGGVDVPSPVSEAIKALRISVDTGADLGNATASAAAAIAQYNNKVDEACGDDGVCLARELHYYQAVSVDYTLNWNNKDSVVRNFVRSTLQRYLPQVICDQLDMCKPRK